MLSSPWIDQDRAPTILTMALEELQSPETLIEKWERFDPDAIPDVARARWEAKGAKWEGDPKLLELAQAKAVEDVHAELEAIDALANVAVPKVGRPRASIELDAVLTAAFMKFLRQGLGRTAAQREAAKFLGSTTSQVAKGALRFCRRHVAMERKHGDKTRKLIGFWLYHLGGMLDELAERRRAATAARLRRYSPKIASVSAQQTDAG